MDPKFSSGGVSSGWANSIPEADRTEDSKLILLERQLKTLHLKSQQGTITQLQDVAAPSQAAFALAFPGTTTLSYSLDRVKDFSLTWTFNSLNASASKWMFTMLVTGWDSQNPLIWNADVSLNVLYFSLNPCTSLRL